MKSRVFSFGKIPKKSLDILPNKVYSIEEIKNIVQPIAKGYGVQRVFLFGSYARGEATPLSDLDFRVDKGNLKGLFALGGLYSDLKECFGKELDLLTTDSLEPKFLKQIGNEEILIYESFHH